MGPLIANEIIRCGEHGVEHGMKPAFSNGWVPWCALCAALAVRFPHPGVPAQGAVPKNSIVKEFIPSSLEVNKVVGGRKVGVKWGK